MQSTDEGGHHFPPRRGAEKEPRALAGDAQYRFCLAVCQGDSLEPSKSIWFSYLNRFLLHTALCRPRPHRGRDLGSESARVEERGAFRRIAVDAALRRPVGSTKTTASVNR